MRYDDAKVGDTIKAGTLVLMTSGEYSSYGVDGLYRATVDVVIPGKEDPAMQWRRGANLPDLPPVVDSNKLSVLLEDVDYTELWS